MSAAQYFSKSYAEARKRFLEAARSAGAQLDSRTHPEKGPDGEELAMEFAVLGDVNAKAGLVVISGTHGPEGYCGSGCQLALLNDAALLDSLAKYRLVLVHAHNPFGFAWTRRTTEENIDLNRNYVDFSSELGTNQGYEELHDAFVPNSLSDPAADAKMKAYEEEHGKVSFMAAMMGGQRTHSDGLFYGGTKPAWSNATITDGLRKHLFGQDVVAVIDIHTGLGPYGVPYLVHGYSKADERFHDLDAAFGEVMRSTAVKEEFDEDMPTEPQGPIVLAMDRILEGKKAYAYVIEYGTYPPEEVLGAHRADNWLHIHSQPGSEDWTRIKGELRRVMYPEFDDWKEMVWDKARWSIERTDEVLTAQS